MNKRRDRQGAKSGGRKEGKISSLPLGLLGSASQPPKLEIREAETGWFCTPVEEREGKRKNPLLKVLLNPAHVLKRGRGGRREKKGATGGLRTIRFGTTSEPAKKKGKRENGGKKKDRYRCRTLFYLKGGRGDKKER